MVHEDVPAEHGELAGEGHHRDIPLLALRKEMPGPLRQAVLRPHGRLCGLDENGLEVAAPETAGAALRLPFAATAHGRVEPDVGHELLRGLEPAYVLDKGNDGEGSDEAYARHL